MSNPVYMNPVNGASYGVAPVIPAQYAPQPMQMSMQPAPMVQQPGQQNQYMIQADGEMAARAWPIPYNLAPGTVIPIWDVDGVHVYFKSVDAYGRLNPIRKARVVFEEEPAVLPEGRSGSGPVMDPNQYVSRTEFEDMKNDLSNIRQMLNGNRQNGRNPGNQNNQNRQGGNENA